MDLSGVTIEWAENPLKSKIMLDDYGRLRLKCAIAIDAIADANVLIKLELKGEPLSNGSRWIELYEYDGDDADDLVTKATARCEEYLKEPHCGDCTCVPVSCTRCHAEHMLGVTTTDGLGKHEGNCLQSAFGEGRETLSAALNWLLTSEIKAAWKGWEAHLERWTLERDNATKWLTAYAVEHGFSY